MSQAIKSFCRKIDRDSILETVNYYIASNDDLTFDALTDKAMMVLVYDFIVKHGEEFNKFLEREI